jgi:hypothetical protein
MMMMMMMMMMMIQRYVVHTVKFLELDGLLLRSQQPATGHYVELDESNQNPSQLFR